MKRYLLQRAEKDEFFEFDRHSPLTEEFRQEFGGLNYYPPDESLRFELEIEPFENQAEIKMQTSTGDLRDFIRYGKLTFEVDGEQACLVVYSNQHGYFLPFVDAQAGKETYGAGRYLELETLPDGKVVLDFNLAYNPFCAYNDKYSCPIPPAENRLRMAIKAGEMNFK